MLSTEKFKQKYGFPEWPIRFRDGAPHTSPFGLQVLPQENRFRIHTATDRGWSKREGYRIWCPFEVDEVEFITSGYEESFGTILRLFVKDADFEMRVMHISPKDLDSDFLKDVDNKSCIHSGAFIGYAGEEGVSFGKHTHTELVSLGEKSQILDDLAYDVGNGYKVYEDFPRGYVEDFCRDAGVGMGEYDKQRQRRGIRVLNNYLCRRKDYHTPAWRTFYDTDKLFYGL